MEKIVEIKGLCKKFGKTEVLHDVSFDIYEDFFQRASVSFA